MQMSFTITTVEIPSDVIEAPEALIGLAMESVGQDGRRITLNDGEALRAADDERRIALSRLS